MAYPHACRPSVLPRLHVITDTAPGVDTITTVRAALSAGAPLIQVRPAEHDTDRAAYDLDPLHGGGFTSGLSGLQRTHQTQREPHAPTRRQVHPLPPVSVQGRRMPHVRGRTRCRYDSGGSSSIAITSASSRPSRAG